MCTRAHVRMRVYMYAHVCVSTQFPCFEGREFLEEQSSASGGFAAPCNTRLCGEHCYMTLGKQRKEKGLIHMTIVCDIHNTLYDNSLCGKFIRDCGCLF